MPDDEVPGEAAIRDQLQQANQALEDAMGARSAELSNGVVINRLYYACFHAAKAVLYTRGLNPSSHGDVLSLFGSEVIATGDAPRERRQLLNRLAGLQKQADYGSGTLDENVDVLLSCTNEFVSEIEALCHQTNY